MPAVKTVRRRKRRAKKPLLLLPEAIDADAAETDMLWDHIAPIQPNPITTSDVPPYKFASGGVMDAGPSPDIVVGYASAIVPLLALPSSIDAQKKGQGVIVLHPPQLPDRHLLPQQRAYCRTLLSEAALKEAFRVRENLTKDLDVIRELTSWETHRHEESMRHYASSFEICKQTYHDEMEKYESERQDAEGKFLQSKEVLENELSQLTNDSKHIEILLNEKKKMLDYKKELEDRYFEAYRRHRITTDATDKRLKEERQKLKETIDDSLRDMASEIRTETNFQRVHCKEQMEQLVVQLTDEFFRTENRFKIQTARNTHLKHTEGRLKQKKDLSDQKYKLLMERNKLLGKEVAELIEKLTDVEQKITVASENLPTRGRDSLSLRGSEEKPEGTLDHTEAADLRQKFICFSREVAEYYDSLSKAKTSRFRQLGFHDPVEIRFPTVSFSTLDDNILRKISLLLVLSLSELEADLRDSPAGVPKSISLIQDRTERLWVTAFLCHRVSELLGELGETWGKPK